MCNATLSFYHCTQSGSAKFDEVLCIRIKPAFSFTCIFYMVIFQLCDTLILESISMYLSIYLDSIFIYSVCVCITEEMFFKMEVNYLGSPGISNCTTFWIRYRVFVIQSLHSMSTRISDINVPLEMR